MASVSLGEAKAQLGALGNKSAAGEPARITRRGKPVAQITAIEIARKPIDPAESRVITSEMPKQPEDAGTFVRTMRDVERY
jgi:prevent-host-death family protein